MALYAHVYRKPITNETEPTSCATAEHERIAQREKYRHQHLRRMVTVLPGHPYWWHSQYYKLSGVETHQNDSVQVYCSCSLSIHHQYVVYVREKPYQPTNQPTRDTSHRNVRTGMEAQYVHAINQKQDFIYVSMQADGTKNSIWLVLATGCSSRRRRTTNILAKLGSSILYASLKKSHNHSTRTTTMNNIN